MRTPIISTFLLIIFLASCSGDGGLGGFSILNSIGPKEVDSCFSSMDEMINYLPDLQSPEELLGNRNWKTGLDNIYSYVDPSDTLFKRINLSGKSWTFVFDPGLNSGTASIPSSFGGQLTPFSLFSNSIVLGTDTRYDILRTCLNTDSTYAIWLKKTELKDTLTVVDLIQIQTFN